MIFSALLHRRPAKGRHGLLDLTMCDWLAVDRPGRFIRQKKFNHPLEKKPHCLSGIGLLLTALKFHF
jgi:hypothetical protein